MKRLVAAAAALPLVFATMRAVAQEPRPQPASDMATAGIPVTDPLTRQKCSPCHKADEVGRLTRISYRRTTPEGWEETIKRMVSLNHVKLEPADARAIVRYLADHHGLAPEEAMPAAFEVERRLIEYRYTADRDTEDTCTRCHSMGRVISQRRTKQEWELLIAMHRGYYPLVDFQAFRRTALPEQHAGPDGRLPETRHPMDKAVEHLSKAFPLQTPEWAAWSATMRAPRIEGTWALAGYEPGKGPVFGSVTIASQGAADAAQFTTTIAYTSARTGERVARTGKVIVYTGYQWRGRSTEANDAHALREVMFVDRDWRHVSGRWFTGAYDEIGMDVRLARVGRDPIVLGVDRGMLKAGASGQALKIYGANLPERPSAGDLSLGPSVTIDRIVSAAPDQLTISVSVAADATPGRRAALLAGAEGSATVAVYRTIDFIKVTPQAGLARVGGANFPKQFQQFEAIAYANGPDGKPDTSDDIELGPLPASWSIEEYTATYDDDDKDYVGTIDAASGLFTPNLDGPNPKRRHNANNYGDVWVVATVNDTGRRPLKGRAHLLVTVPLYIKWDQAEVAP